MYFVNFSNFQYFCRFQAGYSSCAQEAASFLLSTPGVDITVGQRLLAHLTSNMANPIALPPKYVKFFQF